MCVKCFTRGQNIRIFDACLTINQMKKRLIIQLLVFTLNMGAQNKTIDSLLKITETSTDKKVIADAYNDIGENFFNLGSIPKALDYNNKAIKLYEQLGDKKGIAEMLLNMGLVYNNEGDTINAFLNYNKALQLSEEIHDSLSIGNALFSIGYVYRNQHDTKKALEYTFRSLHIRETIGDSAGIGYALNSIGIAYNNQGETEKAIDYYRKSLAIRKAIGDEKGTAYIFDDIGIVYYGLKKYSIAYKYEDSSLVLSKKLGYAENIRNAELMLTKIDSANGNPTGAFEHYKNFIAYRDYLSNIESRKASIKSQLSHEFEIKEAYINAELKHKEQERNYFIAGFVLVAILSIFIFRGYRQTKKAHVVISQQKKIVEKKNKDVMDSIRYAQRIQKALITPEAFIEKTLNRLNVA